MVRGSKILVFDNGVRCDAKNLLKSLAFFEKFEIFLHLLTGGRGIKGFLIT